MTKAALDLGVSDVHQDAPIGERRRRALKPITSAKRKALPESAFALPAKRAYPIHDAAHARNAMARLEQHKGALSSSEYATAKRNILRAYKKFGIKHEGKPVGSTRASIRTAGLSIHVHHMSDRPGTRLMKAVALDASAAGAETAPGTPATPTWNQLAKIGQWSGHPSGPFQITSKEIGEIVRNFRATQNRRIPIDFEHASEAEPTEGSIPTTGAPAQGWIVDLEDRGRDGLWGLVEWGDLARSYVKEKKYLYFSPAIRFNSKDRVSGAGVGARMTSGALTNNPFLDGMAPLMAASDKDRATGTVTMTYAYSADEYMPRVRAVLRMSETATARECMDRLGQIEELYGKAGAVGMTEGVNLGDYMLPMREMIGASIGCCWDEVFETVKALIRAAIGEHNIEKHGEDDLDEGPISSIDMRNTTMDENTIKLRDAEATIAKLTATESSLTLKLTAAEAENRQLKDRLSALETAESQRAEVEANAKVDAAIACYAEKKGLTPALKPHLLKSLKADPAGFDLMYPPIPPQQQHLLRNLTGAQAGTTDAVLARDITTGNYVMVPKSMIPGNGAAPGGNPNVAKQPVARHEPTAEEIRTLRDEMRRKDPALNLAAATLEATKRLRNRSAA